MPDQYVDAHTWGQIHLQGQKRAKGELAKLASKAKRAGIRSAQLLVDGDRLAKLSRSPIPREPTSWLSALTGEQDLPGDFRKRRSTGGCDGALPGDHCSRPLAATALIPLHSNACHRRTERMAACFDGVDELV